MFKLLHVAPFLRILLFFITGIIIQSLYNSISYLPYLIIIGLLLALISSVPRFYRYYQCRFIFGLALFIILFSLGLLVEYNAEKKIKWESDSPMRLYKVQLMDTPVLKSRTIQCKLKIKNSVGDNRSVVHKNIIVYFPKDSVTLNFNIGESFLLYIQLTQAPEYQRRQSVSAIGFVANNQWIKLNKEDEEKSFLLKALLIRKILLERLRKILPDNQHYSIASALMFGYKNEMDKFLHQSFVNVGAGHVLAVSGLHFSLIFGMLYSFLSFIDNSQRGRIVKQIILLPVVWGFAFVINLSPSVVRAACMLSITGIGKSFFKNVVSINSLAFIAFVMLLFNPRYLYDIGFQLSFSAVISILLINPCLVGKYETKNKMLNYFWNLISVSISAQIGVLPLSIYYFHQFPLLFLLTNILVIPIVTVLLFLIPLCLIADYMGDKFTFLNGLLSEIIERFLDLLTFLDNMPFRSVDQIRNFDLLSLFSWYVIIISFILLLIRKRIFYAYIFFIIVLSWLIYYLCRHW